MSRSYRALRPVLIMIILLLTGLFMIICGVVGILISNPFTSRCTAVTYGIVTDVKVEKEHSYRHTSKSYIATVEPEDGSIFNRPSLVSERSVHAYKPGDRIKIYYEPSDPLNNYIEYANPTTSNLAVAAAGGIILFTGIAVYVGRRILRKDH